MKTFFFYLLLSLLLPSIVGAQAGTGQRIKDNARWKTENKLNEKVDRAIDDVLDGKVFKKKSKVPQDSAAKPAAAPSTHEAVLQSGQPQDGSLMKAYSKFDFVPGEKVVYYDDFERVAVGDFPADYNTNGSGEVMTVAGTQGKWLALTANGSFVPEAMGPLPDNFTLEMNAAILGDPSNNNIGFGLHFNTKKELLTEYTMVPGAFVTLHPGAGGASFNVLNQADGSTLQNNFKMPQWNVETDARFARISIWRQKSRLRLYLNETKLMDIPRFFNEAGVYQMAFFRDFFYDCQLLLTDIRLAVGAPDTRNALITQGRFSTTGILFDFQKSNIRPESYQVLKEVAATLRENPTVRVKIVGHTSNDGDAQANVLLSKQRAAAVKQALVNEFGIDASRMETDGKGGSEPVDKTGTAAGKANNRRVEFIKL